jgi:hypothetical protein
LCSACTSTRSRLPSEFVAANPSRAVLCKVADAVLHTRYRSLRTRQHRTPRSRAARERRQGRPGPAVRVP